jgi:molybdopterin/thiamine biosynthesis adenylyltransferase
MRSLIVKLGAAAFLLAAPLLRPCDGQVTLAWNPVPSPALAGYYLCWGTSSGVYTITNTYPGTQTTGVVSNLLANQVYFFVVQGFASNGTVSPFSNEATFTNGPLSTISTTPIITWTNPAPISYGAALNSEQLNATANMPGSFAYNPTFGTVLDAGVYTLSVIFTPTDTVDYNSVTNTTSLAVFPAPLTVTAYNATWLPGAANPVFMGEITGLTNGDNITATYSCSATISSPPGTYPIVPSLLDPNDLETNYTVSLVDGTLTVGPAPPMLTWTNPAPIIYGAALNSNQLNATANVPGNFAYNPTNGAVLRAGTNSLSVIFTPNDTVHYGSAVGTVSLVVSNAPLTVTASNAIWLPGAANPVFTGTITGLTNGDNITATYSCSATIGSPPGTYAIVPSLVDPNNLETNYTVSLVDGTLRVGQATPILTWSNPAPIIYGAALTSNQLNATASVPGSFAYDPTNGVVLNAGTNTLSVIFTPADTVGYSTVTNMTSLVVSNASLTIIADNASRQFGAANPLFTGTSSGLTNGDKITVTYKCGATTISPAGTYAIVPRLMNVNNRQTNYTVRLVKGILTVSQATPILTWTNPAPIIYGAPLNSNQLNATANVPGSFAYYPTDGVVLNAGTNKLSVIFTPTDRVDYGRITNSTSLAVSPASLTVTASDANRLYGAANPVFTGAISGLTNGDKITETYRCDATTISPAGSYAIEPLLIDPNNRQTNYTVNLVKGILTVGQATPIMTWNQPTPIVYGAALNSNQLNATANVPSTFAYHPTDGAFLNAGANTLSVIFTPTDKVGYSSITNSISLAVLPASLTLKASNASRLYGAANPVFAGRTRGLTNGDDIIVTFRCRANTVSPVGMYAIVPRLVDPNNRQTNYTITKFDGTLTVSQATPILTWTNPAPIVYGAPLNSNQLNATANVPGSFAYDPTNGAVLNAGTNTLSVIFTSTDTVNYSSITNTVTLVVSNAPLTLIADNASRSYGAANPVFTGTMTGLTNGDNITATYLCRATNISPAGTYAIVPSLSDPRDKQSNYSVSLTDGTLTVIPVATNVPPSPLAIPLTSAAGGIIYTVSDTGASNSSTAVNSAANFRGIPPSLTMTMPNGQSSLNIAGTVGATMVIQATTNLDSPDSWVTMTNVILTNIASAALGNQTSKAPNILNTAFVPAAQAVSIPRNSSAPSQFFRVVMPYDYAILGGIVLKGQGYTPRLIVVNMPGILCDDACYVNEASRFIHYDRASSALQLEESGASIRQIANTLANSLDLDWTSASEFTFSNGLCRIWATVVRTEPASSDPVAGQNQPSEPMVIDF